MVADSSDTSHISHLIPTQGTKARAGTLRAAAIYGPNGAGKSNLVKAIIFARDRILRGTQSGKRIPVAPFLLSSPGTQGLSSFEFIINHLGVQYAYGFRLDAEHVAEEWLFATPKTQEVLFFQRETSEAGKTTVEFGPQFIGKGSGKKQFLEFVAQGTRSNQLFITEAADRNVDAVTPLIEWFRKVLLIVPAEVHYKTLELETYLEPEFAQKIGAILRDAGTGVEGVVSEKEIFDKVKHLPDASEAMIEEIESAIAGSVDRAVMLVSDPRGDRLFLTKGERNEPVRLALKTLHRTENGEEVQFPLNAESDGTQRLIHLAPAIFSMEGDEERVVIIDELDRRFHPLVCRQIVERAMHGGGQNAKSQLIFTTHDTNLLDLDLLRRDEIWFVEKNLAGVSHLYSLSEFKIRPDLKIEKGYLNGRFGAIPFASNIEYLGRNSRVSEPHSESGK